MESKITFYNEEIKKLDAKRVKAQFKSQRTLTSIKATAEKYLKEVSQESHSAFEILKSNLISLIERVTEDLKSYYELFLVGYFR